MKQKPVLGSMVGMRVRWAQVRIAKKVVYREWESWDLHPLCSGCCLWDIFGIRLEFLLHSLT